MRRFPRGFLCVVELRREGKRVIYAWSITWLIGSKVVVGEKHASRLCSPSVEAKGIASHAA